MPFRINHYASRALDVSGTLYGERIATKIFMLALLVVFGFWLYELGYFWGVVFFGIASIPIGISLIVAIFSLVFRFFKRLKTKRDDGKNT